uniref:RxLR effector candidate protein n=1 Tax=Hyaloperonospora arabidopsidis (strain Emoy2) TaxID=559515 RepID=M4BTK3_HYAAE
MEMGTVKVILDLAVTWGVLAKHGDIPNTYVKANKEEHLDIFLSVPVGMEISGENVRSLRVQSPKISFFGCKKPCMV